MLKYFGVIFIGFLLFSCGSGSSDNSNQIYKSLTCKGIEGTQFVDISYPYMTVYRGKIKFKTKSSFYKDRVENKSWTYWKNTSTLTNKVFGDTYNCG